MDGAQLSHSLPPAIQQSTIDFRRPSFFLIWVFFVISFITFILCCRFISFPSVQSSCMLCRRCGLCSLNETKILAQQPSLHFLFLYCLVFAYPPPFQRGASAFESFSCAVLNLVLVQNFLLQPNFSGIDPSRPDSYLSICSFLLCPLPKDCLPCSSFL